MDRYFEKKADQRKLAAIAARAGTDYVYAYRLVESPHPDYGGEVPANSAKDAKDRLAKQGLTRSSLSVKRIYPKD